METREEVDERDLYPKTYPRVEEKSFSLAVEGPAAGLEQVLFEALNMVITAKPFY